MSEVSLAELSRAELEALVAEVRTALAAALARISVLEQELAAGRDAPPPKTPANSSVPPAKGWGRTQRAAAEPGSEPPGRGPKRGHRGVSRTRLASAGVDLVLPCRPTTCQACGHALPTEGGTVLGRKQVTELAPMRPVVIEAQRWRVRCGHCGHRTRGSYPAGYETLGAFGPRLLATGRAAA